MFNALLSAFSNSNRVSFLRAMEEVHTHWWRAYDTYRKRVLQKKKVKSKTGWVRIHDKVRLETVKDLMIGFFYDHSIKAIQYHNYMVRI